ncbi:MAG: hypothetical protein ACRDV4_04005, partial [Acidimicrobiales bacterium]
GEVNFATSAAAMTIDVEGQKLSVVSSAGAVYESIPGISQVLPEKSWLSLPVVDAGTTGEGLVSSADPQQMIRILESEGNVVTSIGQSTIDGVAVDGYVVQIDKASAESSLIGLGLPRSEAAAAEQFLQEMKALTFRVYIDAQGRLAQMDFSTSIPDGLQQVSVSTTLGLTDYGAPVAVQVPPASEVAPLQQFLKTLGVSSTA